MAEVKKPSLSQLKNSKCSSEEVQAALVELIELHNKTANLLHDLIQSGQIASRRDVTMTNQYGL